MPGLAGTQFIFDRERQVPQIIQPADGFGRLETGRLELLAIKLGPREQILDLFAVNRLVLLFLVREVPGLGLGIKEIGGRHIF